MRKVALVIVIASSFTAWAGKPADAISLERTTYARMGEWVKLQTGNVVLVDLWGEFCPPCKQKFPAFAELCGKYRENGLVGLSVSVDDPEDAEAGERALAFLKKQGATFRNIQLTDPPEVWTRKLQLAGPPCIYLFDKRGRLINNWAGGDIDFTAIEKLASASCFRNVSDTMSDQLIVSPDTQRPNRIPPGQRATRKFVEYTAHHRPTFDPATWKFTLFPDLIETGGKKWSWAEFNALPKIQVKADFHCVTRWSVLDNVWEGVATREVLRGVTLAPTAKFVMVHCSCGYSTNLPIDDFLGDDCLFACKLNGEDLPLSMGYPMRLIVPRLYAWKSAKWANGLQFLANDQAGFWEEWRHGGYHMRGDPWVEQRFRDDG